MLERKEGLLQDYDQLRIELNELNRRLYSHVQRINEKSHQKFEKEMVEFVKDLGLHLKEIKNKLNDKGHPIFNSVQNDLFSELKILNSILCVFEKDQESTEQRRYSLHRQLTKATMGKLD